MFALRPSDRNALVLLVLIILVAVVLIPLVATKEGYDVPASQYIKKHVMHSDGKDNTQSRLDGTDGTTDKRLFKFDPNTATEQELLQLGLSSYHVRNILKYRSKGGHYYSKEDFAQLYGLTLKQYRELEPYIDIKQEVMARDVVKRQSHGYSGSPSTPSTPSNPSHPSSPRNPSPPSTPSTPSTPSKLHYGEKIDINTADTNALKRIPGIGSYFARRIYELRSRKGGAFASAEDLLAIRNFPETALEYMTLSENFPTLHINQASLKELYGHPLVTYTQAQDIMQFRKMKGRVGSISDLQFVRSFTPEQLQRLSKYVSFE